MDFEILRAIQDLFSGSFWDGFFNFWTFFGEETFVILLIAVFYWGIDRRTGEVMLFSSFGSLCVNGILKDVVKRPRPFVEDPSVYRLKPDGLFVGDVREGSFSFPSGHAQGSSTLLASMSFNLKQKKVYLISAVVILLVCLSRIVLGVHFPTDVLTGLVLGIGFATLCTFLFNRFYDKRVWIYFIAAAVSIPFILFAPVSANTVKLAGAVFGFAAGSLLEDKFVKFTVDGVWWKRVLRIVLGVAILLGIRIGVKAILPQMLVCDYFRYALMLFAGSFLYPWLFKAIRL